MNLGMDPVIIYVRKNELQYYIPRFHSHSKYYVNKNKRGLKVKGLKSGSYALESRNISRFV